MRRIILTAIALTLFGGVASADHWRRGWGHRDRDTSWRSGGTVVTRDHRDNYEPRRYHRDRVVVRRNPVYVSNNRFVFGGGIVRTYNRPVIRHRYYDVRYRPQVVVENCDPVEGYIWISGQWSWNGYEWIWTNGYYSPDPNYQDQYYDNSYDNSGYYNDGY